MTGRRLVVAALLALLWSEPGAGAQAKPPATTPVFRSEVRMVEVYASVFDQRGRPVSGLTRDAFVVTDNGVPQQIVSFESSESDLQCALLLDITGSMSRALPSLRKAVLSLIDDLRPTDSVAVYGFQSSLTLAQDFTRDKDAARQAVMHLRTGGRTALFDAITQVGVDLSRRSGRKALIALTDGADNASALGTDAVSARMRKVGVPLYTVAQGEALESPSLMELLKRLAETTGGLSFTAKKPDDIGELFDAIYKDLSQSYMLGYPAPSVADSRWRTISVTVKGSDNLKVRAKQGYVP